MSTVLIDRPTAHTNGHNPDPDYQTEKILDRAVLVRLSIGNWNERTVDKDATIDVNTRNEASPDAGRYVKRLVPKEVTQEVRSLGTTARQIHNALTMPWDDHGTRLLPIDAYQQYVARIDRMIETRIDARNRLIDKYDDHLREARRFCGKLFRAEDYPPPEDLAKAITMEREFMPVPDGRHFIAHLPEEEKQRIRDEIEYRITERIRSAVEDLYRRLYQSVAQASERMQPDPDGNPKTFRNTMVVNLQDIADTVPLLNITNDPRIAELCDLLNNVVQNIEPDHLRPKSKDFNPAKREQFARTMSTMETMLAGYVS